MKKSLIAIAAFSAISAFAQQAVDVTGTSGPINQQHTGDAVVTTANNNSQAVAVNPSANNIGAKIETNVDSRNLNNFSPTNTATSSSRGNDTDVNIGPIKTSSGITGSGNSSNINALHAEGGKGGNASAGASSDARSNSGGNNFKTGDTTTTLGNEVNIQGDTVTYEAQRRNPVSTAYAAPLSSSNGTCMGSSSGGVQGAAVGISFGTTWTDNGCDMRYDAEALRAAGLIGAAQARLCQKPEIAQAMEAAGTPCPGNQQRSMASAGAPVAVVAANQAVYTDPIIRARLGLAPLAK